MIKKLKLVRITTAPISLRLLITGQPAYMREHGFEVILISAEGNDWGHIPNLGNYHVAKVDMARQISIMKDIKSLIALVKLFKNIRPDIVHSHTPKAGLLAMVASKIAGVPVRVHTLAGMPLMTAIGLKRQILFQAEKITFAAANEVWVNSRQLLNFVLGKKMANSNKARIILNGSSNGIDLTKFHREKIDLSRVQELKSIYKSDLAFCFLAVGRMVNDKGIAELVNSFLNIYSKNTGTRLFLLGPFETADALPGSLVNIIKSHPAIHHVNWSDEVENFMYLANCFVHASHREGFPNVVLQAAAMAIPVICSDIPGNIDIVENETEGFVYPVKNQDALEKNMRLVLSDYSAAKQKAIVLSTKVQNNFDRPAVHKAIKDRYLHLLKQKNIDVSSIL